MRTIVLAVLLAIIGTFVFSVERLSFSSYALFSGPLSFLDERIIAAALLVSLSLSLILVHRTALRLSSERAAWSALALILVSAPVLLAPLSVNLGFFAVPLLALLTYQLSSRKYRLVSIAIPLAALIILGFGHYPLFVIGALLLASPLRPDPDPRLGELFLITALGFLVSGASLPVAFSVDRTIPFGLVFIALVVFAVYRVISQGSRRADPIVALALTSLVLFVLGDPIASIALVLSGGVLASFGFESLFRFFDVSNIKSKRPIMFLIVVVSVMLTISQSLWFIVLDERMDPQLAASMRSIEQGEVAIDERLAPALRYFSSADPIPLSPDEVAFYSDARLTIPVLRKIDDRFSRIVLESDPVFASDDCFARTDHGRLYEVRVRCSLS